MNEEMSQHLIFTLLDMLSEDNEKYVEFGMSGLCNFCLGHVWCWILLKIDTNLFLCSSILQILIVVIRLLKMMDYKRLWTVCQGFHVNCSSYTTTILKYCYDLWLFSSNEETVLSAITTLIYLKGSDTLQGDNEFFNSVKYPFSYNFSTLIELGSDQIIECMTTYSTSSNTRLANIATVYLEVGWRKLIVYLESMCIKVWLLLSEFQEKCVTFDEKDLLKYQGEKQKPISYKIFVIYCV